MYACLQVILYRLIKLFDVLRNIYAKYIHIVCNSNEKKDVIKLKKSKVEYVERFGRRKGKWEMI